MSHHLGGLPTSIPSAHLFYFWASLVWSFHQAAETQRSETLPLAQNTEMPSVISLSVIHPNMSPRKLDGL